MENGEAKTENVAGAVELSFGQKRVRASFNPGENPKVTEIKKLSAQLIDLVNEIPGDVVDISSEQRRLLALAMTSFEEGAMWAVKSATA